MKVRSLLLGRTAQRPTETCKHWTCSQHNHRVKDAGDLPHILLSSHSSFLSTLCIPSRLSSFLPAFIFLIYLFYLPINHPHALLSFLPLLCPALLSYLAINLFTHLPSHILNLLLSLSYLIPSNSSYLPTVPPTHLTLFAAEAGRHGLTQLYKKHIITLFLTWESPVNTPPRGGVRVKDTSVWRVWRVDMQPLWVIFHHFLLLISSSKLHYIKLASSTFLLTEQMLMHWFRLISTRNTNKVKWTHYFEDLHVNVCSLPCSCFSSYHCSACYFTRFSHVKVLWFLMNCL